MTSNRLSSRERMLAAINHQEPDYVPLWFNWHYRDTQILKWNDPLDRAEKVLRELGLDDTLLLGAPLSVAPEVTTRVWRETRDDLRYPLISKEYYTPKGTLRQVVQETEDWEHPGEVGIIGDLNVPRSLEFPVKDLEDIERLKYLFQPPNQQQLEEFRERAKCYKDLAERLGVLIEGGWICLGDMPFWLMGVQGLIFAQNDQPELLDALLDAVLAWEKVRIELLIEAGADIITHRAWYETTDFWGVAGYREFLVPRLKREVELVHSAGLKFSYIITTGVMPRLDDLLDIGIDILWGLDPVQDKEVDPREVKKRIGAQVCLLGGLNATVTLGLGSEEEIRQELREAVRVLAPGGGCILSPIDNIFDHTPKKSLETLIDEWKRVRDYPIRL